MRVSAILQKKCFPQFPESAPHHGFSISACVTTALIADAAPLRMSEKRLARSKSRRSTGHMHDDDDDGRRRAPQMGNSVAMKRNVYRDRK